MNESNNKGTPSFELPRPVEADSLEAEKPAPETSQKPVGPTTSQTPPVDPSQYAQTVAPDDPQSNQPSQPVVDDDLDANDLDVIEKQWVEKAKKIIKETAEDPKEQKRELSNFSAEYLKKRYGKDIKVDQ